MTIPSTSGSASDSPPVNGDENRGLRRSYSFAGFSNTSETLETSSLRRTQSTGDIRDTSFEAAQLKLLPLSIKAKQQELTSLMTELTELRIELSDASYELQHGTQKTPSEQQALKEQLELLKEKITELQSTYDQTAKGLRELQMQMTKLSVKSAIALAITKRKT